MMVRATVAAPPSTRTVRSRFQSRFWLLWNGFTGPWSTPAPRNTWNREVVRWFTEITQKSSGPYSVPYPCPVIARNSRSRPCDSKASVWSSLMKIVALPGSLATVIRSGRIS